MNYVLIDCSHVCYAAYYSLPRLSADGKGTEVMYGFLQRVLSLAKDRRTNKLIFCWDSPYSIRKDRYSWYKEKRGKQKDEAMMKMMQEQMEILRNIILPSMGFKNQILIDGYEADDTMAYLVESRPNKQFYICANDGDLFQIMKNRNLSGIYRLKDKRVYKRCHFKEDYLGLSPKKWHLVKAIAGCSTDEVPGVEGVGEMTAVKYLTGNLPSRYKAYQKIESPEGRKIKKRNMWLVTLPLPGLEEKGIKILRNDFDKKKFKRICDMYRFNSIWNNRFSWFRVMKGSFG